MYDLFKKVKDLKVLYPQLKDFGFIKSGETYTFTTHLKSSGFTFTLSIDENGNFSHTVYDPALNEEYTLHLVDDVEGKFAIGVRCECEQIVSDFINKCCLIQAFSSSQTKRVQEHILQKYCVELEFPWADDVSAAIWRHPENKKWFGIVMKVDKTKLGYSDSGKVEVMNLKATPQTVSEIVDGKNYLICYHMNKKHWFSVVLDGRLSDKELFFRIDDSFNLTQKK